MYIGKIFVEIHLHTGIYRYLLFETINEKQILYKNIFFRTDESKKTRLHIGGGIRLELVGEGDLYLECLSNYSVFVESFYLDAINNRAQGSTVHKFSSGANTKVRYRGTTWPFSGL